MRPAPGVLLLVLALVLAGATAGITGAAQSEGESATLAQQDGRPLESCTAASPADFSAPSGGDAIGYVDGYWYDEPLEIAVESGDSDPGEDNDSDDDPPEEPAPPSDPDEPGANDTPANETTTDDTPANETTTDDTPANETATDDTPANDTATDDTTTAEQPRNGTVSDGGDGATDGNSTATTDGPAENEGADQAGPDANQSADDEPSTGQDTGTDDDPEDAADSEDGADSEEPVETRAFDPEDGIDEAERDAIVARTAARVETLRCLNFRSVPEVAVMNRSAIGDQRAAELANRTSAADTFDQARLEAGLLLGSETDAATARAEAISTATLGFYQPATDEIVLVAQNGDLRIDERTLAHELVHALQDQQFDLERFDAEHTDPALAESGLIEGDAALVEHHYAQRCGADQWIGECLEASPAAEGDSGHVALELLFFQPENDGPRYVQRLYSAEGWTAVDERYDAPPNSSKQTVFIDTPSTFVAESVEVPAVEDPNWVRVLPSDGPDTDRLGPGAIAAAAIAPTFDVDIGELYGPQFIRNEIGEQRLDPLRPYNYRVDIAEGWAGGRLQVYRNRAGQFGSVWRTTWESPADARVFRDRYLELLTVHGAESESAYVGTATFDGDSAYDGSVSVLQEGPTVTVVHGPSLTALQGLSADAARPAPDGYRSAIDQLDGTKGDSDDDPVPGLGVLAGLLALVAAGGLLSYRLHRTD